MLSKLLLSGLEAARVLVMSAMAAIVVLAGTMLTFAQDAKTGRPGGGTGEAGPDWLLQCSEATESAPKACRVLQNIVMQASGQRLLTVVVEPRKGAPNHTLVLALPHGVFLPTGAAVKVDESEPVPLVIQTSDANGAYAGIAISDDLAAALKKGRQMIVSFKSAQQQDLAVPVTLIGFTAAYSQL